MELTAKVSLLTAIIELILAVWLYTNFKKTRVSILFFILMIILGTYQILEYLICIGGNFHLWGKIAFIIYTFFPPIILYFASSIINKDKIARLMFIPAILVSIYAIFTKNFVYIGECNGGLALINNKIINNGYNFIPTALYDLYFLLLAALTVIYLHRATKKTRSIHKKYIYRIISASTLSSLLFSHLTIAFYPTIGQMYPSLLHRFLTFFVLSAVACVYLEKQFLEDRETKNPE